MEKITYILGAGFSAVGNLPIMSNFITKAKDLYYSNKEDYKHFKTIFDKIDELGKIKTYFNADLLNIEELLSIFDMEKTLEQSKKKDNFSKFIIDVINSYSFKSNDIKYSFPGNWIDFVFGEEPIHKNFVAFASSLFQLEYYQSESEENRENSFKTKRLNSDKAYSIISLNYDAILENSITAVNKAYNSENIFNKNDYIEDWSTPMLFKLHGDVETNKIIPPTWSKSISTEMRVIWQNAFELLKNSTQIRFLGYSLPVSDSYFQYFLKAAIKNNPYLKNIDVLCLDKSGSVFDRYNSIFSFRDLRCVNENINSYCRSLWERDNPYSTRKTEKCNKLESIHSKYFSTN